MAKREASRSSNPNQQQHQRSDARWRANMSSCYETLKFIVPDEHRSRRISKVRILKETDSHIEFLEDLLHMLYTEREKSTGDSAVKSLDQLKLQFSFSQHQETILKYRRFGKPTSKRKTVETMDGGGYSENFPHTAVREGEYATSSPDDQTPFIPPSVKSEPTPNYIDIDQSYMSDQYIIPLNQPIVSDISMNPLYMSDMSESENQCKWPFSQNSTKSTDPLVSNRYGASTTRTQDPMKSEIMTDFETNRSLITDEDLKGDDCCTLRRIQGDTTPIKSLSKGGYYTSPVTPMSVYFNHPAFLTPTKHKTSVSSLQ